ncbi:hypothetical protein KCP75_25600 [Salmonella enterica subsp. enterica]|nr:hypothetical protein KCP75_25600 [Salmonella enterica subsp. enterica]
MRVNPAFCCHVLVSAAGDGAKIAQESGSAYYDAFAHFMNDVLDEACRSLAILKRLYHALPVIFA